MKKKLSRIFVIMVAMGLMLLSTTHVQAALQANGNTSKTDTLENWIVNVRKMESTGGTLGLTDIINNSTLLSTATKSNNLDIHMEKNTEFGAMAILSASSYGNPNKISNGDTTTGNKTGIVINLNKEMVAVYNAPEHTQYKNMNKKYIELFDKNNYNAKAGDAISETAMWHGATKAEWLHRSYNTILLRSYSGSIFSYYGGASSTNYSFDAYYNKPWSSRAVIVVGNGF